MTQIARADTATRRAPRSLARARDYVELTRPRVLSLVLLTAPAGMALGRDSWPSAITLLGVLIGTALVGAGCGALNAWYECEQDSRMARTADRPVPAGRLTRDQALAFGLLVSALGLLALLGIGGWLPFAIGAASIIHYLFVYTAWLKPRTPQAVVIGGAAGAIAPVIADAAAHGSIGVWSLILFAIVFVWQPAHFWAIALYRKQEYAAAGFPMLPCVVGDRATRRHMLAWAVLLVPVTLLPWLAGAAGNAYATVALAGGVWFTSSIWRAMGHETRAADRRVFAVSIAYLTVLFAVLLLDLLLG
jgi:protoheme IX farnesyltransferase